jgi:hypothetical protein
MLTVVSVEPDNPSHGVDLWGDVMNCFLLLSGVATQILLSYRRMDGEEYNRRRKAAKYQYAGPP